MLKYICKNIIQDNQTKDYRDFINNVVADIFAENLNKRK